MGQVEPQPTPRDKSAIIKDAREVMWFCIFILGGHLVLATSSGWCSFWVAVITMFLASLSGMTSYFAGWFAARGEFRDGIK